MILISHRGNINGRNELRENSIEYISEALNSGFDVEIDVWYKDDEWFLGHNGPENYVVLDFLKNDKLWCHAKNIEALNRMLKNNINCFWHQEDDVTLTSNGYIWTYPRKELTEKSIVVMPEKYLEKWWKYDFKDLSGICSDHIGSYE